MTNASRGNIGVNKIIENALFVPLRGGVVSKPVSYTHLDVYKRQ